MNVSVLVLERERVDHDHFRAPSAIPVLAIICIGLLLIRFVQDLFAEGEGSGVILRVAILLTIGAVLYAITNFARRRGA